jgi:myo-inositol-1(or 4)-monophosphatase
VVATSQPPLITEQSGVSAAAGRCLPGMLDRVAAVRNLVSTSWQIADVAAGRLDLFWLHGSDPTNLLGSSLLAREAGASVTTCVGAPWTPTSDSFLAAPPGLAVAVLAAAEQ